jgi:hypothetical protein
MQGRPSKHGNGQQMAIKRLNRKGEVCIEEIH